MLQFGYVLFLLILLSISITFYLIYKKKVTSFYHTVLHVLENDFADPSNIAPYSGLSQEILTKVIKMKKDLRRYMFDVQVAYSQIAAVSQQLSLTLDENNAFTQELYATAKEVSALNEVSLANADSTVKEVRDLLNIVERLNSTLIQMQETSNQSRQIITEKLNDMMQIISVFQDIQATTRSTMESIATLNHSSSEISNILQTVNDIADNTHLLSLNASIESARAGAAGLGFGVVAEEIRKLSDRSMAAVQDIQQLISRITSEINNVSQAATRNLDHVERSAAYSQEISRYLDLIRDSYDEVEHEIQNIMNISKEQFAFTSNINKTLTQMGDISAKLAEEFDVVYHAVSQQKDNVEEIRGLGEHLLQSQKDLEVLTEQAQTAIKSIPQSEVATIAQKIIQALKEEIVYDHSFLSWDPSVHEERLEKFLAGNPDLEAIWTNDAEGKFIYSSPPAQIANASVRNWFTAAMNGKEFISDVYISAITHNPCVTVSLPIMDSAGKPIGVIGADLKLSFN